MKVVILGNGPSRDLYKEEDYPNAIVIGCNLPKIGWRYDYVSCVDAAAVMLAYRRNFPNHKRLESGEFKLILGPRAVSGIKTCKASPASVDNLYEHLSKEGYIEKISGVFLSVFEIGQRYLTSGHQAFMFAVEEYDNPEIHLFGFDSLTTGVNTTITAVDLREWKEIGNRESKNHSIEKPLPTVTGWFWLWNEMLKKFSDNFSAIYNHCYDGEKVLDELNERGIKVIHHVR